jgi:hypothetical protein
MLLGCGRINYELLPPKQHFVSFLVVIQDKYTSLEIGENEFRWMVPIMRQISQLQPMIMGSPSF